MSGDEGRTLGDDPVTGHQIVVKAGRYGPYVTEPAARAAARARAAGRRQAEEEGGEEGGRTEAAHRQPVQGHVARVGHPRRRAAAALAAPRGRRRPADRRRDHRPERPLRPVPQEGHRLALARRRGPGSSR
nr:topoisomerase C-terminal repeat-containing protein [Angustibacter aerolatus]